MRQRNLTTCQISIGISQLAQDDTLCCYQVSSIPSPHRSPSHRLHRRDNVWALSTTLISRQLRFVFCFTRYLPGNLQLSELPTAGDGDSRQTQFNIRGGICLSLSGFLQVLKRCDYLLLDEPAMVAS